MPSPATSSATRSTPLTFRLPALALALCCILGCAQTPPVDSRAASDERPDAPEAEARRREADAPELTTEASPSS